VNRDAKGLWSDDTHNKPGGIYELDTTTQAVKFPRYGGSGYVDDKMKERAKSLQELAGKGVVINLDSAPADIARAEPVFTDPWDRPILYYRASPTSLRITGAAAKPGIYWQEDNGVITGTKDGLYADAGLDFGDGQRDGVYHELAGAKSPEPATTVDALVSTDDTFKHTFARFIVDASVKARPTPVQKDSYLLISAGPDARYGTEDDVLNWTRETN
jgi:hypothetical protein